MKANAQAHNAGSRIGDRTAGWSEERIAINDARFRDANESIETRAQELDFSAPVPFLCECADPSCMTIIRLSSTEYEEIRALSTHFLNAPGHVAAEHGSAHVVAAEGNGYTIVEKTGRAAEVAQLTDPRAAQT